MHQGAQKNHIDRHLEVFWDLLMKCIHLGVQEKRVHRLWKMDLKTKWIHLRVQKKCLQHQLEEMPWDFLGFESREVSIRDINSSDPYVVVKMREQKLKTRVIKKDINPEWNEDLNLSVLNPNDKIMLTVYDRDFLSKDDKMGDADIDIGVFMECLKMELCKFPTGTVITRVQPNRQNCLAEESSVVVNGGRVVQDMCLRLRNVACGALELQLSCPIA